MNTAQSLSSTNSTRSEVSDGRSIQIGIPVAAISGWVVGSILSVCCILLYFRLRTLLYLLFGLSLLSVVQVVGQTSRRSSHVLESADLELRFVPSKVHMASRKRPSLRIFSCGGLAIVTFVILWQVILLKLCWDIWSLFEDSRI